MQAPPERLLVIAVLHQLTSSVGVVAKIPYMGIYPQMPGHVSGCGLE
jgi:hypothetical protein